MEVNPNRRLKNDHNNYSGFSIITEMFGNVFQITNCENQGVNLRIKMNLH